MEIFGHSDDHAIDGLLRIVPDRSQVAVVLHDNGQVVCGMGAAMGENEMCFVEHRDVFTRSCRIREARAGIAAEDELDAVRHSIAIGVCVEGGVHATEIVLCDPQLIAALIDEIDEFATRVIVDAELVGDSLIGCGDERARGRGIAETTAERSRAGACGNDAEGLSGSGAILEFQQQIGDSRAEGEARSAA